MFFFKDLKKEKEGLYDFDNRYQLDSRGLGDMTLNECTTSGLAGSTLVPVDILKQSPMLGKGFMVCCYSTKSKYNYSMKTAGLNGLADLLFDLGSYFAGSSSE